MFANKLVLTSYKFPSFTFLTLAQFLTTCMLLLFARMFGYVSFPPPQNLMVKFRAIFPLQILFLISTLCSLGGTKHVSMPVFIMLRRTTVPLTMLLEYCLENKIPSSGVAYSVILLMFGAIVAVGDARAPIFAACLIMVSNICSAGMGVVSKRKMEVKGGLGTCGLLFYNSFFSLIMFAPLCFLVPKISVELKMSLNYESWNELLFCLLFISSCVMASLLNLSSLLCTKANSALTTMVLGVLKNIFTTYVGMYVGGDFHSTYRSLVGINISMMGSLMYAYINFFGSGKHEYSIKRARRTIASIATLILISYCLQHIFWPSRVNHASANTIVNYLGTTTRWDSVASICENRFLKNGTFVNSWEPGKRPVKKEWRPYCKPVQFGVIQDLVNLHSEHLKILASVKDNRNWLRTVSTYLPNAVEDPLSKTADMDVIARARDKALCQSSEHPHVPCRTDWTSLFHSKLDGRFDHCRLVILTANFGGQDITHRPKVRPRQPDMVCFVAFIDNITEASMSPEHLHNSIWHFVTVDLSVCQGNKLVGNGVKDGARRCSRIPKTLPFHLFPQAWYSIWVDSKLKLKIDPVHAIKHFLVGPGASIALVENHNRECTYVEFEAVVRKGLIRDLELGKRQMSQYRFDDFPENAGLPDTSFIMRANTAIVELFGCQWLNEYGIHYTTRDQLSFMYVLRRTRAHEHTNLYPRCEYLSAVEEVGHVHRHGISK